MPASSPLLPGLALGLLLAAPAASGFDDERQLWLLPHGLPTQVLAPGRAFAPQDFVRMQATANDPAPAFAGPQQRALIAAVQADDRAQVEALLRQGVNPNARPDEHGRTALLEAVERGQVETVRMLLAGGADPDLAAGGFTPLVLAALRGEARIAGKLLQAGAEPDRKAADGNTPLTAAAALNRVAVLRVLVRHAPDPTQLNRERRTALSVAAQAGYLEAVRVMLEAGLYPEALARLTPADAPAPDAHAAALAVLRQHGASPIPPHR